MYVIFACVFVWTSKARSILKLLELWMRMLCKHMEVVTKFGMWHNGISKNIYIYILTSLKSFFCTKVRIHKEWEFATFRMELKRPHKVDVKVKSICTKKKSIKIILKMLTWCMNEIIKDTHSHYSPWAKLKRSHHYPPYMMFCN